jgi:hypothetical protein
VRGAFAAERFPEVTLNVTVRQLLLTTIGTTLMIVCVLFVAKQASTAQTLTTATADPTPSVASLVLAVPPKPDVQMQSHWQSPPEPVLASAPIATLLTRYLRAEADSDGRRAEWAGHIRNVTVGLHAATVHTDLADSPQHRLLAQQIADVAARFVVSAADQPGSPPDIKVVGANEQEMARHMVTRVARKPWSW